MYQYEYSQGLGLERVQILLSTLVLAHIHSFFLLFLRYVRCTRDVGTVETVKANRWTSFLTPGAFSCEECPPNSYERTNTQMKIIMLLKSTIQGYT